MIDQMYVAVLRTIATRLTDQAINWVVTGSLGFALQGLPVQPHDIDLQTDAHGAYALERCFSTSSVRPVRVSQTERIQSHFGAFVLNGIQVEIMGNIQHRRSDGTWDVPIDLQAYKRYVMLENLYVPVLSLVYEEAAYRKLGRIAKANMLRTWLEQNPHT